MTFTSAWTAPWMGCASRRSCAKLSWSRWRPPKIPAALLRQGVAAALACGLLLTAALAAAPVLWVVIRDHLGSRASYASQPQGDRDRPGTGAGRGNGSGRPESGHSLPHPPGPGGGPFGPGGGPGAVGRRLGGGTGDGADSGGSLGYDPENGTWLFYRTFSRMEPLEVLRLQVREIVPGYQDFYVDFSGAALAEACRRRP